MTDKHADPADVERVILAAIGAAGQADDVLAWRKRVASLIPEIASMLEEYSPEYYTAKGVLTATVFRGVYRGYRFEESSKRLVVSIEAFSQRAGKEKVETTRTERTDELAGQVMRAKLDLIKPGTEVRTYKVLDKLPNGDSARCLVNIVPLTMADKSAGNPTPAAPEPDPHQEPARPSGSEAVEPAPDPERSEARALLEAEGMVRPGPTGGASIDEIIARLRAVGKYGEFTKRAFQEAGVPDVNRELSPDEANKLRIISEELLSS